MPVKINGSTSGSVTLAAPATGSDVTLTLPAATGTAATTANVTTAVAPMGLVAVAPTSIANSGGSASLSNYTVSFSGVSSVSLNGVFSGDYDNYRVLVSATTGSTSFNARLRASGTDASGSDYRVKGYYGGTGSGNTSQDAQTTWSITSAGNFCNVSADLYAPAAAAATRAALHGMSGNADYGFLLGMSHALSTAYDGITFYVATGTMTGTVSVYGYRK